MRLLTLLLLCLPAFAGGPSNSGGGFPVGDHYILSGAAACPSGWTEVTTHAGQFIVAMPASGTAGDELGTGIATTTTDLTITATAACSATSNFVTTAGVEPACDNSPVPTVTMGSTANQRSELTPMVSLRLCKKG